MVSFWFLLRLWRAGELFGTRLVLFTAWFLAALLAQLVAPGAAILIAGLAAQVLLAVVVVLKDRIDNIY